MALRPAPSELTIVPANEAGWEDSQPSQDVTLPGELHVGSRSVFAAAGFTEIGRPTVRRVVMRIDF